MSSPDVSTRDLLNAQTGKAGWTDLVRHFARGALVSVDPSVDLVKIAEQLVLDRKAAISRLHAQGKLHRATDSDAIRWQQNDPVFWAVVVAPWVLVQEIEAGDHGPAQGDTK